MFDDLLTRRLPTEKRIKGLSGEAEKYLSEGAVILAYGMHLLRTEAWVSRMELHPDGEHGKRFEMRPWLKNRGFDLVRPTGKTNYGGEYRSADGQEILIHPISGVGDVVAIGSSRRIVAEYKGGVLNTKHPGQTSRLRRGLCEADGLLLCSSFKEGDTQIAVVPKTSVTEKLAAKMASRAKVAGIRIALVDGHGRVFDVPC